MNTLPPHAPNGNLYTVYILIDPRDYLIRYVGISNDVYRRFIEHIKGNSVNPAKDAWIQSLRDEQVMMIMQSIDTAPTLQEAMQKETRLIHQLLEEGFPLFNVSCVASPSPKIKPQEKLRIYRASNRNTAQEIDDILDYYILTGNLPSDVSDRQRYYYRHHSRLEDRRKLLGMSKRKKVKR